MSTLESYGWERVGGVWKNRKLAAAAKSDLPTHVEEMRYARAPETPPVPSLRPNEICPIDGCLLIPGEACPQCTVTSMRDWCRKAEVAFLNNPIFDLVAA